MARIAASLTAVPKLATLSASWGTMTSTSSRSSTTSSTKVSSRLIPRARAGGAPFFPFPTARLGNSFRSRKLMGTFNIKASAAPANSGDKTPQIKPAVPMTASILCKPISSSAAKAINTMIRFMVVREISILLLPRRALAAKHNVSILSPAGRFVKEEFVNYW